MTTWKEEQLNLLGDYQKEVVDTVNETIGILNENYIVYKDIDAYIQVIESLEELK